MKQKLKPRSSADRSTVNRHSLFVVKGSLEFRDWLLRFSEHQHMPVASLVEQSLARNAELLRFSPPPPRNKKR
jgi:hypothetical protein